MMQIQGKLEGMIKESSIEVLAGMAGFTSFRSEGGPETIFVHGCHEIHMPTKFDFYALCDMQV